METVVTITPTNAALVLIEFQNQWTRPGFYHALIGREMQRLRVMENAQAVTTAARKAGVPVIHAPLVIDPGSKRGLFAHLTQGMVFRAGTSAAEIDARVFDRHDLVAKGRTAFDAFVNSDLEALMRSTGRSVFLFGGFATDQCVVRTIRTALRKELDAWLIEDCAATFASFLHRRATRRLPGRTVRTGEILARFEVAT